VDIWNRESLVWVACAIALAAPQSAQSEYPWPPEDAHENAQWVKAGFVDSLAGQTLTRLRPWNHPDENYLDDDGNPIPLDPCDDSGPLAGALALVAKCDEGVVDELKGAVAADAIVVYAIAPSSGRAGSTSKGQVAVVLEGRTNGEIAAALIHEWTHQRNLAGHFTGEPVPLMEEFGACNHAMVHCDTSECLKFAFLLADTSGCCSEEIAGLCAGWKEEYLVYREKKLECIVRTQGIIAINVLKHMIDECCLAKLPRKCE